MRNHALPTSSTVVCRFIESSTDGQRLLEIPGSTLDVDEFAGGNELSVRSDNLVGIYPQFVVENIGGLETIEIPKEVSVNHNLRKGDVQLLGCLPVRV